MKFSQKNSRLARMARGAAVVAAGTVLALSNAPVASAETGWIYVHGGKARWDSLNRLVVCDTAVDGNRVRVQLQASTGGTVYYSDWAPSLNNDADGCNTEGGHPTNLNRFRVCAENHGCSSWYAR